MIKTLSTFTLAAALAVSLCASATVVRADPFGTPDEARAMLDRAVAALKADEKAALRAFNDPDNKQFRDRDLYVFCFSLTDGNFTAYLSPALIGTDIRDLKLRDDPIGQRAYDAVHSAAEGSYVTMDYKFPKPGTKTTAVKLSLETRVGNQACGVSYFK
jgi:signal transduction histidine kinase